MIVRVGALGIGILLASAALAETPPTAVAPTAVAPTAATPSPRPTTTPRAKRENRTQKDAEGSTAPDRFEAETVIRSRYTLDGKTLEVDTD